MKYELMLKMAQLVEKRMKPYCDRIQIAGSIRRKKPEPRDIEILCIPKTIELTDLFSGKEKKRVSGFAEVVDSWVHIKGNAHDGKYMQRMMDNVKIDIFTATPETWAMQLAIRTGSAEFSHRVLANRWVKLGYHAEGGMLMKGDKPIPVFEEEDLFKLLQLEYVEPWKRNV